VGAFLREVSVSIALGPLLGSVGVRFDEQEFFVIASFACERESAIDRLAD